jgi:alginate O-acetyltransferase complex protein AlgI
MAFDSLEFLLRFLPAILLLDLVLPGRFRNGALLLASLAFYTWGEPRYLPLLLLSIAINYLLGLAIERSSGKGRRPVALAVAVAFNLSLLGLYKYADLLIGTANQLLGTETGLLHLSLPVGISFYTFQALSYAFDVHRAVTPAERSPLNFALYMALFPQLLAGPIVRHHTFAPAAANRQRSWSQSAEGIHRFLLGLSKKVLIANNIAPLWQWSRTTSSPTVLSAWLGIVAFAFQLYFDFSGYSDMAIGLGKLFGLELPENFRHPYASRSATEFWRRWHITLGQWFRDYLYIPLGGNRVTRGRWIGNVLVVWSLTGLWHGASWNFLLWGAYFGLILVLEKLVFRELLQRLPAVLQHAYTLLVILVSWVLFELRTVSAIAAHLGHMFLWHLTPVYNAEALYVLRSNAVLLLVAAVASTPFLHTLFDRRLTVSRMRAVVLPLLYVVLLTLSLAYIVDSSFTAFLYFQF